MYYLRRRKKGFTLLETIVSLSIFSMILVSLHALIHVGRGHISSAEVALETDHVLQTVFMKLRSEFRHLSPDAFIGFPADGQWANSISYQVPASLADSGVVWDANPVTLQLSGLDNNQITRMQNSISEILASEVDVMRFKRDSASPNIITVQLGKSMRTSMAHQYQKTLESNIYLRN